MSVKDKGAYNKVIKARTLLLMTQPFFGSLALQLELLEVDKPEQFGGMETMAVDGRHMYYHPPFVHKLKEEELQGVVAHECMHCCYQHMTRRGHRHHVVYNAAGDFVINADLKKSGLTLPNPHLYDTKYEGMSTEEVYERLMQNVKFITIELGLGQDGKGDGKKQDPGGCGGVMDASGPNEPGKNDEIRREWEGNVRMAVNVARANNAGKIPGYLERLVNQLEKPRINWRDKTRQFIDQSMSKDYSYQRPNRRYIGQGLIMPGFIPDALHHMVFIGDTSGSISNEIMRAYVSEVAAALDSGTADELTVLYADTHVRHVDKFQRGDIVTCRATGGGGTSFVDAINWVNKNAPDAACCVYLTDMMPDHWNLPKLEIPMLWAAFTPEQYLEQVRNQVPYGEIILVDSSL